MGNTYGVDASGSSLKLQFVTQGPYSRNVGSRLYLLDSDDTSYQMFHLANKEFTFDVDVSKMPCGLNGALYFVQMTKTVAKASTTMLEQNMEQVIVMLSVPM